MQKDQLRRKARRLRATLDPEFRYQASAAICRRIAASRSFRKARHVAFYLPVNGEVDVRYLIATASELDKRVYLPIVPGRYPYCMEFGLLEPETTMETGSFGIHQPVRQSTRVISPRQLDLVIAPLVAFDPRGNRLGMGAGYYDRCFRFLRHRRHWIRPRLLGVAYDCQRSERLESDPWDVPMWCIATETNCYPESRDI